VVTIDGTTNKVEFNAASATITNDVFDENGTQYTTASLAAALYADSAAKVYKVAPAVTAQEVVAKAGTDYTYTPAGKPALYDADGNKISENGLDSYLEKCIAAEQTKTAVLNVIST